MQFIQAETFVPQYNFLSVQGETTNTYLGVELEVDYTKYDYEDEKANERALQHSAKKILDIGKDVIYIKRDKSLTCGFEIVTHPATLIYHRTVLPWKKILKALKKMGFQSSRAFQAGLHVHISNEAFGDTEEERFENKAKLLYMVSSMYRHFIEFSRRNRVQLVKWALIPAIESRESAIKFMHHEGKENRRVAVNVCNNETVEMRIFRGTLDYTILMASLELCRFLPIVVSRYDFEQIKDLNWDDILFEAEAEGYDNLIRYTNKLGIGLYNEKILKPAT